MEGMLTQEEINALLNTELVNESEKEKNDEEPKIDEEPKNDEELLKAFKYDPKSGELYDGLNDRIDKLLEISNSNKFFEEFNAIVRDIEANENGLGIIYYEILVDVLIYNYVICATSFIEELDESEELYNQITSNLEKIIKNTKFAHTLSAKTNQRVSNLIYTVEELKKKMNEPDVEEEISVAEEFENKIQETTDETKIVNYKKFVALNEEIYQSYKSNELNETEYQKLVQTFVDKIISEDKKDVNNFTPLIKGVEDEYDFELIEIYLKVFKSILKDNKDMITVESKEKLEGIVARIDLIVKEAKEKAEAETKEETETKDEDPELEESLKKMADSDKEKFKFRKFFLRKGSERKKKAKKSTEGGADTAEPEENVINALEARISELQSKYISDLTDKEVESLDAELTSKYLAQLDQIENEINVEKDAMKLAEEKKANGLLDAAQCDERIAAAVEKIAELTAKKEFLLKSIFGVDVKAYDEEIKKYNELNQKLNEFANNHGGKNVAQFIEEFSKKEDKVTELEDQISKSTDDTEKERLTAELEALKAEIEASQKDIEPFIDSYKEYLNVKKSVEATENKLKNLKVNSKEVKFEDDKYKDIVDEYNSFKFQFISYSFGKITMDNLHDEMKKTSKEEEILNRIIQDKKAKRDEFKETHSEEELKEYDLDLENKEKAYNELKEKLKELEELFNSKEALDAYKEILEDVTKNYDPKDVSNKKAIEDIIHLVNNSKNIDKINNLTRGPQIKAQLIREIAEKLNVKVNNKDNKKHPVKNFGKNHPTLKKVLLGVAGFGVGYATFFIPGAREVRMTIAIAKLAGGVTRKVVSFAKKKIDAKMCVHTALYPDGKLAKISKSKMVRGMSKGVEWIENSGIVKGIAKFDEFIAKPETQWFLNGMALGYLSANVVDAVGLHDKIADAIHGNAEVSDVADVSNVAETEVSNVAETSKVDNVIGGKLEEPIEAIENKQDMIGSAVDAVFSQSEFEADLADQLTQLGNAPLDLSSIEVARQSSTASNTVKMITSAAKGCTFDKYVNTPNGIMFHFKQANGLGLGWYTPEQVNEALNLVDTVTKSL